VNIYEPKKDNVMKYMTFCGEIKGDCARANLKKSLSIFAD
jgi:hypothetical protein